MGTSTRKHLVLAGAGHAHLTAMGRIAQLRDQGLRVTVVNSSSLHYYSGMGPGMLAGTYAPDEIRFDVRAMVESRDGEFVEDPVAGIKPEQQVLVLASGTELSYDCCSFNVGSGVARVPEADAKGPEIYPVKPIIRLLDARQRILELLDANDKGSLTHVAVVGGGAAGIEIAGNAQALIQSAPSAGPKPRVTLLAGSRLLKRFPDKVRTLALKSLSARKIDVVEDDRATGAGDGCVRLESGREIPCELVFWATGVKPNPLFERSGLATGPGGGLLVNQFLQAVDHPNLFGGGDCIHFQPMALDKVGVHAVRQNPLLAANPAALLQGRGLMAYRASNTYLLLLNLGDGTAIFRRGSAVFRCKLAMWLKNRIDTRFMQRFQKLERA